MKRRGSFKVGLWVAFISITVFLITCAPAKVSSVPSTEISSKIESAKPEAPGKEDWGEEWNPLMKAAEKEGKLIIYTSRGPETRQALSEGFKKRTGLDIDWVAGRGGQISQKFLTEHRAGIYLADAFISGTTTLVNTLKPMGVLKPIMPELFLPEVLDTRMWYKGALPFMDKDKYVIQVRYTPGGTQMDAIFHTNFVKKEDLTSWYDLLKPEYNGRMNMQDPTTQGKGLKFVNKGLTYYGLDWDYMRALAAQQPFITRDERLQVEWVAQGKYIIGISPDSETSYKFIETGASIDHVIFKETKELLGGGGANLVLTAKGPHPIATRLFANWYLSKEGQTILSYSYNIQSAREDTPRDHLTADRIRKPNVEYVIESEEFVLKEEKILPQIVKIFGPLIK